MVDRVVSTELAHAHTTVSTRCSYYENFSITIHACVVVSTLLCGENHTSVPCLVGLNGRAYPMARQESRWNSMIEVLKMNFPSMARRWRRSRVRRPTPSPPFAVNPSYWGFSLPTETQGRRRGDLRALRPRCGLMPD